MSGLLQFCAENPHHPRHSQQTLERFLKDLSSSEGLVCDYFYQDERVLAGVLIDRIQNPSNSATLEVLGFKTGGPYIELLKTLIKDAKVDLPSLRSGFELNVNEKSELLKIDLEQLGLKCHYTTYDMSMHVSHSPAWSDPPPGYQWHTLTLGQFAEYYELLSLAFAKNLETSIPPIDEMRSTFTASKYPATLLCKDKRLIGFYKITVDDSDPGLGEVHLLGLHPEFRKKGLGQLLLSMALRQLFQLGAKKVKLTVAAQNDKALGLYTRFGFTISNHDRCYFYSAR